MSGSRGEANFVWKCKNCKRESSASILAAPTAYEQNEPAKPKAIITFDCRGLEFTEFIPEVCNSRLGRVMKEYANLHK